MIKILTLIISISLISTTVFANEKQDDIIITINGMVCDFCAQSLKKVFGKEDSVNHLTINLDDQTVIVDTKNGASLSDDKIKELVEWGGYDLVEIKRP